MRKLNNIYFICILLFLSQICSALQQAEKLWTSMTLHGNNGGFIYSIEPQIRFVSEGSTFQQFLNTIGGGYQVFPEWQFWLGQTTSADSQDAAPGDQDEIDLWEQILWAHHFSKFMLISRSRFEDRYSMFFPKWSFNFRERVDLRTPIANNLTLIIRDEIFYNLNLTAWIITKPFDQNQAYIGIEQAFTPRFFFSVGYLNQYLTTNNPQLNHVLVFNFRIELDDKFRIPQTNS